MQIYSNKDSEKRWRIYLFACPRRFAIAGKTGGGARYRIGKLVY